LKNTKEPPRNKSTPTEKSKRSNVMDNPHGIIKSFHESGWLLEDIHGGIAIAAPKTKEHK
jgi:hypothetical protein